MHDVGYDICYHLNAVCYILLIKNSLKHNDIPPLLCMIANMNISFDIMKKYTIIYIVFGIQ